jgi:hypothetical protein
MRRDTDAPVPLCGANCPRAPWTFEPYYEEEEEEEEEDEQGRLVLFGEVTERSYAACDCGLAREAEDVTVRRMPTCASCDATDAARRGGAQALRRVPARLLLRARLPEGALAGAQGGLRAQLLKATAAHNCIAPSRIRLFTPHPPTPGLFLV